MIKAAWRRIRQKPTTKADQHQLRGDAKADRCTGGCTQGPGWEKAMRQNQDAAIRSSWKKCLRHPLAFAVLLCRVGGRDLRKLGAGCPIGGFRRPWRW